MFKPSSQNNGAKKLASYRNYEVYHQSGGTEQAVFDSGGNPQTRSARIVRHLSAAIPLAPVGDILDIGCGNGSFLSTFGGLFPDWRLFGAEVDDKDLSTLETIPGFQRLYTGPLADVSSRFDAITLIHTLEHIEAPIAFLAGLRPLLKESGFLLIQVPHYLDNPFELMTADHASHFDEQSLGVVLERAGFQLRESSTSWVSKELTALATAELSTSEGSRAPHQAPLHSDELAAQLSWLADLLNRAKAAQKTSTPFGLFGSSIAATWTAINLPKLPDFFVDEDPARIGKNHLSKPIIAPPEVPEHSGVFIALQPNAASSVAARLVQLFRVSRA